MSVSFWLILAITGGVVFIAVVLLCIGIILRKDHSFRSQHVSENERMRENKIRCATSQDRETRKQTKLNIDEL